MTRIEPKLPTPPIDSMLREGLEKLAGQAVEESFAPERKRSQFAVLGHQAIDAMIAAAEEVVRQAQAELDHVKGRAEQMRKDFDARDAEIQTMQELVAGFGQDQLNAHAKFTDGNKR